jgi:glutaredoxin-like YruB-family protein
MAEKNVVVYSTPTCPYCKMVKDYLSQNGVTYTDHDLSKDYNKAREMVQKTGQMGVPVVIIDDNIVVGFNRAKIDELLAS